MYLYSISTEPIIVFDGQKFEREQLTSRIYKNPM